MAFYIWRLLCRISSSRFVLPVNASSFKNPFSPYVTIGTNNGQPERMAEHKIQSTDINAVKSGDRPAGSFAVDEDEETFDNFDS